MNQNPYQVNLKNVLEKYDRDVIETAKADKIDQVVDCDKEIRSIMFILSRKTKKFSLIGEPGIGKAAIVASLGYLLLKLMFLIL